jgi:hypothetical protein
LGRFAARVAAIELVEVGTRISSLVFRGVEHLTVTVKAA